MAFMNFEGEMTLLAGPDSSLSDELIGDEVRIWTEEAELLLLDEVVVVCCVFVVEIEGVMMSFLVLALCGFSVFFWLAIGFMLAI